MQAQDTQSVSSPILSRVSSVEFASPDVSRTIVEGDLTATTAHEHEHEHEHQRRHPTADLGDIQSDESSSPKKRVSQLPSPPLTRVGTNESTRIPDAAPVLASASTNKATANAEEEGAEEEEEMDLSDWHAVTSEDGRASSQEGSNPVVPSRRRHQQHYLGQNGLQRRHQQQQQQLYEMKTPSPQAWELVSPVSMPVLSSNGHAEMGMYYGKDGSRFAALQSEQ
jgi:hypothetical protein